jgi:hypothetical protein
MGSLHGLAEQRWLSLYPHLTPPAKQPLQLGNCIMSPDHTAYARVRGWRWRHVRAEACACQSHDKSRYDDQLLECYATVATSS